MQHWKRRMRATNNPMKTIVKRHLRKKRIGKTIVHTHKRTVKKPRVQRVIDPVPVVFWKIRDAKTGRLLGTTTTPPSGTKAPNNYTGLFGLFSPKKSDDEQQNHAWAAGIIKNKQSEMKRRATTISELREKPAITLAEQDKIIKDIDKNKRKIISLGEDVDNLNKEYFPDNPR